MIYINARDLALVSPFTKKNNTLAVAIIKSINIGKDSFGKDRIVTLPTPPIAGETRAAGKLRMVSGHEHALCWVNNDRISQGIKLRKIALHVNSHFLIEILLLSIKISSVYGKKSKAI